MHNRDSSRKPFFKFVVLVRNTTWRCGKLERAIVVRLHQRWTHVGSRSTSVKDITQSVNAKDSEVINALKRLEKRSIVRLLP
jgi:hypothetical protein